MQLTRRSFVQRISSILAMITVAGTAVWTSGCNLYDQIYNWANVGIKAFAAIVSLLAGAGILSTGSGVLTATVLGFVTKGLDDVEAAVKEYESAPAGSKQTIAGKISTFLQVVADQVQQFYSDLHVGDARLASLVQGLIGIILSTIAGFMTQLPPPATKAKAFPNMLAVSPKVRNTKQFTKDFNSVLVQNGFSQYVIQ